MKVTVTEPADTEAVAVAEPVPVAVLPPLMETLTAPEPVTVYDRSVAESHVRLRVLVCVPPEGWVVAGGGLVVAGGGLVAGTVGRVVVGGLTVVTGTGAVVVSMTGGVVVEVVVVVLPGVVLVVVVLAGVVLVVVVLVPSVVVVDVVVVDAAGSGVVPLVSDTTPPAVAPASSRTMRGATTSGRQSSHTRRSRRPYRSGDFLVIGSSGCRPPPV